MVFISQWANCYDRPQWKKPYDPGWAADLSHGGLLELVKAGVEDVAPEFADIVDEAAGSPPVSGGQRQNRTQDQETNRPAICHCVRFD